MCCLLVCIAFKLKMANNAEVLEVAQKFIGFQVKDVSYRPPGTQINLLNGVNISLPEKRYSCLYDD